jgi:putative transcriptional regulator
MTARHPSDATLAAAANGTLPELHIGVIALHVQQCPLCQAALRACEAIGGALLETLDPAPLATTVLARTLTAIDADAAPKEPPNAAPPSLISAMAGGNWRWLAPGIHLKTLIARDATGTRLDLIRVAPGTALPAHDHTGPELSYVIQGAFADETGEYRIGDVAEGEPGLDHAPVALPGEHCICLIATTGRLRARSRIARAMQSMLDI